MISGTLFSHERASPNDETQVDVLILVISQNTIRHLPDAANMCTRTLLAKSFTKHGSVDERTGKQLFRGGSSDT